MEKKDEEENMSAAEKKRLKNQQKRQQKKEEEKTGAKAGAAGGAAASKSKRKVDEDPDGEKLLQKDLLEEASKIVANLLKFSSLEAQSHVQAYEVFSRQGRTLGCLQALVKLKRLGGGDLSYYKLLPFLGHFCFALNLDDPEMNPAVQQVVMAETALLLRGCGAAPFRDVKELRDEAATFVGNAKSLLLDESKLNLIQVLSALKCLKHAEGSVAGTSVKELLKKLTWEGKRMAAIGLKDAEKVANYLSQEFGAEDSCLAKFKEKARQRFPQERLSSPPSSEGTAQLTRFGPVGGA